MPPLSPPVISLLGTLIERNITGNSSSLLGVANTTTQVICAWPVSGQYGPGTRFLYYVLVATCVFGRGYEWLKGACLAGALLLPAVAALHGIVLAAVHVDGAVDMDVYGAFQICAIGVLAGPVTVKISATYFNTPGRNLIFLWTGMVLAGLLSLTVEFFRTALQSCPASEFQYGVEDQCGIMCSPDHGPSSPMRGGSQNNIYVIEAPRYLAFGTATLLSAACCIPAILSLVSMWNKILQLNWTMRFGDPDRDALDDEPISGTNKATPAKMTKVNNRIRFYLSMVEIPVYGAAILAVLAVGERNFFDPRVSYMTEPIASVGQWAPIVGTGLAAMGSLYALMAQGDQRDRDMDAVTGPRHRHCSPHRASQDELRSAKTPSPDQTEAELERRGRAGAGHGGAGSARRATHHEPVTAPPATKHRHHHHHHHPTTRTTPTRATAEHRERRGTVGSSRSSSSNSSTAAAAAASAPAQDAGSRREVARAFEWLGDRLGTPAPDAFDDSAFTMGRAADFPTVPAEEQRNAGLPQILASYNPRRDSDGNATPTPTPTSMAMSMATLALHRQRSRAASLAGSVASGLAEAGAEAQRAEPAAGPVRPPVGGILRAGTSSRRATLEVPTPASHQSPIPRRDSLFQPPSDLGGPLAAEASGQQDPSPPAITVSLEAHDASQENRSTK